LTTILPSIVFGPILHDVKDVSSLNLSIALFRNGIVNHAPTNAPNDIVDVRDVALSHVLALERSEAGGERIIVSNIPLSWHQLTDTLIQAGYPVTRCEGEDTSIPHAYVFDNSKSKKILGLNYRPLREMAVDTYAELKRRFPESFP